MFASKTTRSQAKTSQTPGPGSYVNSFSGVHRIIKNIPESFGTTVKKSEHFLNWSVDAPYCEPSYLENPGVGNYSKNKFERIKKIKVPGRITHSYKNDCKVKSI